MEGVAPVLAGWEGRGGSSFKTQMLSTTLKRNNWFRKGCSFGTLYTCDIPDHSCMSLYVLCTSTESGLPQTFAVHILGKALSLAVWPSAAQKCGPNLGSNLGNLQGVPAKAGRKAKHSEANPQKHCERHCEHPRRHTKYTRRVCVHVRCNTIQSRNGIGAVGVRVRLLLRNWGAATTSRDCAINLGVICKLVTALSCAGGKHQRIFLHILPSL